MKKILIKKIIPFTLIISFVLPGLTIFTYPKQAKAQWEVNDPTLIAIQADSLVLQTAVAAADKVIKAEEIAQSWIEKAIQAAIRLLVRALIQVMTQDIINWINSGFQGSPAFMTNPAGLLENAADKAVGEYILMGPLNFLCEPFQLQVKLNLGMQYSYGSNISCTLTGILGNIQNAYDDFVGGDFLGGGGWDSWMQIASNPQNTPQGAAMMAEGGLEVKLAGIEKINLLEADWGGGSLSLKKCKENVYDVSTDGSSFGGTTRKLSSSRSFVGSPSYGTATTTTSKVISDGPRIGNTNTPQKGSSNNGTPFYAANQGGLGYTDFGTSNNFNSPKVMTSQQTETKCETTTPGAVIMDSMKLSQNSWMVTSQIDAMLADSINAILGAFATQIVKMTINKVKGGLMGGDNESVDYLGQVQEKLNAFQNDPANDYYKNPLPGTEDEETPQSKLEKKATSALVTEQTNLENYVLASTTLNKAKTEFQNSSCDWNTKDKVLSNIAGTAAANQVYFSLPYITLSIESTKTKITTLQGIITEARSTSTQLSQVGGVSSTTETIDLTSNLTTLENKIASTTANSTSTTNLRTEILSWLNSAKGTCSINTTW